MADQFPEVISALEDFPDCGIDGEMVGLDALTPVSNASGNADIGCVVSKGASMEILTSAVTAV
jgi:hypothetical protein